MKILLFQIMSDQGSKRKNAGTDADDVPSSKFTKVWWVVQYQEGGKCGVIESNDIVAGKEDLTLGSSVEVVTAHNKATGRRYPSTLLKGPFNTKKGANASVSLCARPVDPVPLPRSCPSCQQLKSQLADQTQLTDTLRK